ncbi:hypothetical protein A0H81_04731 [Grifola frondosa]|uniref:C2H2-type domain-containing protein n=1 Tax=Grifola frondosa TaxID=5627 RepID=A0A1C7MGK6_GRIFR|nr:hypothetical protein A0H81_04731 [Grifola frondosa]
MDFARTPGMLHRACTSRPSCGPRATEGAREHAQLFTYHPKRSFYEQFSKVHGSIKGEGELEAAVRRADEACTVSENGSSEEVNELTSLDAGEGACGGKNKKMPPAVLQSAPFFSSMFTLFEGSLLPMGFVPDRPHMEQRHTYLLVEHAPAPACSNTDPYFATQEQQQGAINTGWMPTGDAARTKAFVCPLFSCGCMFKRVEHLKQHLCMHMLEPPFQCPHWDSLAQHERTHMRGSGMAREEVDVDVGDEGMEMNMDELEEEDALILLCLPVQPLPKLRSHVCKCLHLHLLSRTSHLPIFHPCKSGTLQASF